jgi:glycosyltransferase involved in cell wall biosynthesis
VPSADVEALAAAIVAYAEDVGRLQSHGRAGRLRVEQQFSLDRMVDRYHRLYLGALGGAARTPEGAVATQGPAAR